MHDLLEQVSEVQERPALFVVTISALDILKVKPLNLHAALVVVRAQIQALDPCDVDLVQDRVVHLDHELLVTVFNRQLNAGLFGKGLVVLWRHHVLGTDAKAAVGQAVQRTKPREVKVRVEFRELGDRAVACFVGRLLGERKVTDVQRGNAVTQFLFNDVEQISCFPRARRAEDFFNLHSVPQCLPGCIPTR